MTNSLMTNLLIYSSAEKTVSRRLLPLLPFLGGRDRQPLITPYIPFKFVYVYASLWVTYCLSVPRIWVTWVTEVTLSH